MKTIPLANPDLIRHLIEIKDPCLERCDFDDNKYWNLSSVTDSAIMMCIRRNFGCGCKFRLSLPSSPAKEPDCPAKGKSVVQGSEEPEEKPKLDLSLQIRIIESIDYGLYARLGAVAEAFAKIQDHINKS